MILDCRTLSPSLISKLQAQIQGQHAIFRLKSKINIQIKRLKPKINIQIEDLSLESPCRVKARIRFNKHETSNKREKPNSK